jgi:predicted nucleic acid-binding protein
VSVVVDASVALKWVLQEEYTEEALALRSRWQDAAEPIVAPPTFRSEVTNVLHRRALREELTPADARELLDALLPAVNTVEPNGLYGRALAMAEELTLHTIYDALYLALAESEGCEFWTADLPFVRSVRHQFPRVRWITEVV